MCSEMTHADLVRAIAQYLRLSGWYVLQTPRGGIPGLPGFPDLVAFRAGRMLLVEVKVGRDKVSWDQQIMAAQLQAEGFPVLVARCLDDVMEAVK